VVAVEKEGLSKKVIFQRGGTENLSKLTKFWLLAVVRQIPTSV
jgi:hypothetical protein